MFRFIGRRLLVAIPTLFLVITVAFFMMRAAPGSPFDTDRKLSPEIEANVLAKYGMNKPLGEQYVDYLAGVVRGDLGPSLKYRDKSVLQILKENYAVSLKLGLSAIIIAAIVGVSLGASAAGIMKMPDAIIPPTTRAVAVQKPKAGAAGGKK